MEKKVNILGSEWTIKWVEDNELNEYSALIDYEGFTDSSIRTIIVDNSDINSNKSQKDLTVHRDKVLRHEIIHAFLIESGIDDCYHTNKWGHDEIMVDWIAIQFPKIEKVFKELNISTKLEMKDISNYE